MAKLSHRHTFYNGNPYNRHPHEIIRLPHRFSHLAVLALLANQFGIHLRLIAFYPCFDTGYSRANCSIKA